MIGQDTIGKPERLASLDVFRGITIAGMILVNNPGRWADDRIYGPLLHAKWHGWTPTDLVFPSFLFIVGVALTFSFDKRVAAGFSRLRLFEQVIRRTIILICLGLILHSFPRWRLMAPYIGMVAGLGFLFADEPPFGWPSGGMTRLRKAIGWVLAVGAVVYFVVDFGHFQTSEPILRVPGVLQRIGLCYFFASIVVLYSGLRGRVIWTAVLLLGYWAILAWVHPPVANPALVEARPEALLQDWLDVKLLGAHIYSVERPEPEGLLSTIPAIATTLLGVLAGNWLHTGRERNEKTARLFLAANLLLFAGLWMNLVFPINKKIWTSSYVLLAGGIAMNALAMCYWLIDIKGWRRWAWPFMVFGTNAITLFFASGIVSRLIGIVFNVPVTPDGRLAPTGGLWHTLTVWFNAVFAPAGAATWPGQTITLKTWLFQTLFESWAAPKPASLMYSVTYILIWLVLMTPLYHKRIFIKV